MRIRRWFLRAASIAAVFATLIVVDAFSASFIMYRVRTEVELAVASGRDGTPLAEARIVPIWTHSHQPVPEIAPATTSNSQGVGVLHLDLSFCRGEGLISSLFFHSRPNYAYVPFDFVIEHPGFNSRVLTLRDDAPSWLERGLVPPGFDAKLVFRPVELQPHGSL